MVAEILLVAGLRLVEMKLVAGVWNLAHGKTSATVLWLEVCPGILVLGPCLFILGKVGARNYAVGGPCVGVGLLVTGCIFALFLTGRNGLHNGTERRAFEGDDVAATDMDEEGCRTPPQDRPVRGCRECQRHSERFFQQ